MILTISASSQMRMLLDGFRPTRATPIEGVFKYTKEYRAAENIAALARLAAKSP